MAKTFKYWIQPGLIGLVGSWRILSSCTVLLIDVWLTISLQKYIKTVRFIKVRQILHFSVHKLSKSLCGRSQTSAAFLKDLQGTRGTAICSKWICAFKSIWRLFQLFTYFTQINLPEGTGWICKGNFNLCPFTAHPLCLVDGNNCHATRGERKSSWNIGGNPQNQGKTPTHT